MAENENAEVVEQSVEEAVAGKTLVIGGKEITRNKLAAIIVAAVIVVAALAMWVWHEQPGFCNAICHSPMDAYVESYESGDPGMLATQHAAAKKACLDCHEAELTTQVSEVMAFVADDYPMDAEGRMLATGTEFGTEEFCTQGGCHDMTEVVANTWGFCENAEKYNPHASHQDNELECGDCHRVHETSELYCAKCHALNLPEGWEVTRD